MYKPDKIQVRNRLLQSCSHGDCKSWCIWDYPVCWTHLNDKEKSDLRYRVNEKIRTEKSLIDVVLSGTDLSNMDFSNVNLQNCFLNECNLSNCNFTDASLEGCFLGNAVLDNSNLTRVNLHGAILTGATLWNVILLAYSTKFNPVNLYKENFKPRYGNKKPKINEKEPYFAHATYRDLKRYFVELGKYDDASWAAFKEREMQKQYARQTNDLLNWIILSFWGFSCGYGEKPLRIIGFCLLIVITFGFLYKFLNLAYYPVNNVDISWPDSFLLSFATFSTYSFEDILIKPCFVSRLLTSTEAFIGIFSAGLFVFTLTKKYSAR